MERNIESQFRMTQSWVDEFNKYKDEASHIESCFSLGRLFGMISMMKSTNGEKYEEYRKRYEAFEALKILEWRKE